MYKIKNSIKSIHTKIRYIYMKIDNKHDQYILFLVDIGSLSYNRIRSDLYVNYR